MGDLGGRSKKFKEKFGMVWRDHTIAREKTGLTGAKNKDNGESFHLCLCAHSSERSHLHEFYSRSDGIRFMFTKGVGEPASTLVLLLMVTLNI